MKKSIWIGYDARETDALAVCAASIRRHLSEPIEIFVLDANVLRARGLYQRPTEIRDGKLWDVVSGAPMSTDFAISRFFMPHVNEGGLALFMDCDMLVRCDLAELFALADPGKAVQVVQHEHKGRERRKMDGQEQTSYPRKNWSSVCLWNLEHPAHRQLNLFKLNQWSGRALHNFSWLCDHEIGALDPTWNHLVGVNEPNPDAKIVHFTLGIPRMEGYADCEHSFEWWACHQRLF